MLQNYPKTDPNILFSFQTKEMELLNVVHHHNADIGLEYIHFPKNIVQSFPNYKYCSAIQITNGQLDS